VEHPLSSPFQGSVLNPGPQSTNLGDADALPGRHRQCSWRNELVFHAGQDPARLDLSKNGIDTTIHRFKEGREY